MHVALMCPPFPSHIKVFEVLGSALQERGHRVLMALHEGAETHLNGDVPFAILPAPRRLRTEEIVSRAANPRGIFGILRTVTDAASLTECICVGAPDILRAAGIDALVGDQMEPGTGLVARHLGLPFVSIACALPLERDERIPPPYLGWPYAADEAGIRRNRGGEKVSRVLLSGQRRMIRHWARRFDLPPLETLEDCLAPGGTVSQTPAELDFPRTSGGRALVQVGAIRETPKPEKLPWDIDPRRPFIFMSLGTLQGHRFSLFKAVARACQRINAQLLVAHCGMLADAKALALGATWVTDFAPQRAVLERADICVTHGGLNTVLDALQATTPLLVLPIAFDQPGIAARVVHHGVGLRLMPSLVTTGRVEKALRSLLHDPSFRNRARALGSAMEDAGGLPKAVATIEQLLGASA